MTIPVFISTDINYVVPSITLITSIMENTASDCTFYVLSDLISDEFKNKFNIVLEKYKNLEIEFLEIDPKLFENVPIQRHFTKACCYRFLIPKLKPELDKAIYLDVDMIVNFDIKELFETSLEDKPIGAVVEKCMRYFNQFIVHCSYLDIDHRKYFNSGLLLMDLKYFRENNITEKLFSLMEENFELILCPDQDVLNILFKDNWKILNYSYNLNTGLLGLLEQHNDSDKNAYSNVKIYHWAGEVKPWNNSKTNYADIWFKYANLGCDKNELANFLPKKTKERKKFYLKKTKYKREYIKKYFLGIPYSKKKNPDYLKLIMTIVCKNEEDIIEKMIRFHKEMGIDGFIVIDHNSCDSTPSILNKLKDEGLVLEIIKKTGEKQEHSNFFTELINIAKNKYGATWVINADVDEFYFSKDLNIKTTLKKYNFANALLIQSRFLFPDNRENFFETPYFVTKPFLDFEFEQMNLETNEIVSTLSSRYCTKVIHKTEGFVSILDGNHDVNMKNKKMVSPTEICFYHYHIKNYKGLEEKTKRWADSLKLCPKEMNKHLKKHLKYYNMGKLREYYDSNYNKEKLERFIDIGFVSKDYTIYNYMKQKGLL